MYLAFGTVCFWVIQWINQKLTTPNARCKYPVYNRVKYKMYSSLHHSLFLNKNFPNLCYRVEAFIDACFCDAYQVFVIINLNNNFAPKLAPSHFPNHGWLDQRWITLGLD